LTITREHFQTSISLNLLAPEAAAGDDELRRQWEASLHLVNRLNRFYSSPAWFFHRTRVAHRESDRIGVIRDGEARVLGVCPLDSYLVHLSYAVKKKVFGTARFQAAVVLGGEFMLPPDPVLFQHVIDGLFKELTWCACIALETVPEDSFTWEYLEGLGRQGRDFFVYVSTREPRAWHYIELGKSFEEYVDGMKSKSRTNIKNKLRKFHKKSGGTTNWRRVQAEDEVEGFYESAVRIAKQSWRYQTFGTAGHPSLDLDSLKGLARLNLLRAYLLTCDQTPLAYVVGHQFQGVYHYAETAYVQELRDLSPGTVLLYMLLEDLHGFEPADFLNFGAGDGTAKRLFGNRSSTDREVFLFRRTLRNRLHTLGHGAFRTALSLAKRFLRDRPKAPGDSDVE